VAEKLKEIPPSYIIYIDGHTDDLPVKNPATVEAHRDLWGLGANRALTVLRALEGMAVNGSQMLPRSFAAYDPIDPAKTPAARRKNRRVEISVEPKPGSSTAEPAAIE